MADAVQTATGKTTGNVKTSAASAGNVKPAAGNVEPPKQSRFNQIKRLLQRKTSLPKGPQAPKPTIKERLIGSKAILYSPYALYAALMVLVVCIVAAGLCTALYNRELKKRNVFLKGVNEISNYMGRKFPDLLNLEDVERIKVATNLSKRLFEENKKNKELQDAIDDILERLKHHWIVHNRKLYLFDIFKPPRTWQDCADYCEAKPHTMMINIANEEDEAYVESQVQDSTHDFWIGLYKRGGSWSWTNVQNKTYYTFWAPGQPDNRGYARPGTQNCVGIIKNCSTELKCWHDALCTEKKKCVCRMHPQKKWLT